MTRNQQAWLDFVRGFPLASVLYLLSAACILVGIGQIIVPIYGRPELAGQKFLCLSSLNLYELALLAVALLVVLWRRATDDGVALALLAAAFLIASGVALDAVVPDYAWVALWLGLAGLLAAAAKLWALGRYVVGRFAPAVCAGVLVMLAANFLLPAALGLLLRHGWLRTDLVHVWMTGLWVLLAGAAVLVVAAGSAFAASDAVSSTPAPFLRTPTMRWIIAGILFTGVVVQQYALTWVFNLPLRIGDFLPVVAVAALGVLELRRTARRPVTGFDFTLAVAPLLATLIVLFEPCYTVGPRLALGLVAYPPLVAILTGAALMTACWRRHAALVGCGLAHGAAGVLFFGATAPDGLVWHWAPAALVVALALAVLALATQRADHAVLAAVVLAAGLAGDPSVADLAEARHIDRLALAAMALGSCVQALAVLYERALPRWVARAGLAFLIAGQMHTCFRGDAGVPHPVLASVALLLVMAPVAWLTRDRWLLVPSALPLGVATYRHVPVHGGWGLVVLSFIILALGAAVSIWRHRPGEPGDAEAAEAPEAEEVVPAEVVPQGQAPLTPPTP